MDEFMKMDVFFVVTTIAVIVVAGFAAYVLWRLQRVLKSVEHISEQVAKETDNFREDLSELRSGIKEGKGRLKSLIGFIGSTSKRAAKKSKKT